jgi:ABC-type glycerol-3-phosphate transport system substrate-binding protein
MNFRPNRATLLALLALIMLLAACQSNTPPPNATPDGKTGARTPSPAVQATSTTAPTPLPTATPEPRLGAEPEELRGQVVQFWHPWQGELAERVQQAAEAFNKSNTWGVRVRVTAWYGSGALAEAVAEVAAGSGDDKDRERPSALAATSEQLAGWAVKPSLLVDLTPYIENRQSGLSLEERQAYAPAFWSQDQHNETRFGLPALRTARVLFYNETWAKELGFSSPPSTPANLKAQACAAAQANNAAEVMELSGTGGWVTDTDALTTLSWLAAFGADPLSPGEAGADGGPTAVRMYAFESEAAEEALVFLRGMIEDGCAWIGRSLDPQEYFARRRALFISASPADAMNQARWQEVAQSEDRWVMLPYPSVEGAPVVVSGGYSYGVVESSPGEQLAAWLFVRWLSEPEQAAALMEGWPSLPVRADTATLLEKNARSFPWNQILPLAQAEIRPAPGLASWRAARRAVEDAAWQVYHLPADMLPDVLPSLDAMLEEMSAPE